VVFACFSSVEHLAVLQGCVEFAYLDVGAVRHPDLLEAPEGLADGALVVVGEGGTGVAKVVRDADCQGNQVASVSAMGMWSSGSKQDLQFPRKWDRELTCILERLKLTSTKKHTRHEHAGGQR
jgi:hypothetical protein